MVPWCTALVWPGMDRSWLCLSLFSSFSCVVLPWSAAPEWSGRVWDVWLVPLCWGVPRWRGRLGTWVVCVSCFDAVVALSTETSDVTF